jgi:hypothetical protein
MACISLAWRGRLFMALGTAWRAVAGRAPGHSLRRIKAMISATIPAAIVTNVARAVAV